MNKNVTLSGECVEKSINNSSDNASDKCVMLANEVVLRRLFNVSPLQGLSLTNHYILSSIDTKVAPFNLTLHIIDIIDNPQQQQQQQQQVLLQYKIDTDNKNNTNIAKIIEQIKKEMIN